MNSMSVKKITTLTLATAAFVFATSASAQAQYIWLNDQGVKQFSDMPPPASVPKNRILKQPGGFTPPPAFTPPANTSATPAKETAAPTLAEQNADFQKRKMEKEEKEKKAAEETKYAADKKATCERAQGYQRVLDSGNRISKLEKDGEKTPLSDEQRARESADNKRILDQCK